MDNGRATADFPNAYPETAAVPGTSIYDIPQPVMVLTPLDAYCDALLRCGQRYELMSRGHEVNGFVVEFVQGVQNKLPLMKLNRWLGYIQGTLIAAGRTTVTEERDWTRPLFRPIDFGVGKDVGKSEPESPIPE